jgi:hypothetical protein
MRRGAPFGGRRHMKFVWVNGRTPRPQSSCALCCEPIGESYLRDLTPIRSSFCDYKCYVGHGRLTVSARREFASAY